MRLIVLAAVGAAVLLALFSTVGPSSDLAAWAVGQQRAFQGEIAGAVRALKGGAPGAWAALLGAAGAYGVVHAVGPGHGKYLIGGVGLGTSVSTVRLLSLAVLSSLMQSLWAIVLVYGGMTLLAVSAQGLTDVAERVLAPASYAVIGAIGVLLMIRGARGALRLRQAHLAAADHACGCNHAHGPSPEAVAGLSSLREAAALVFSIAMRPCTGAVILLVIAWQLDILLAGAIAVVVMGLGTGIVTSLVAVSSVAARGLAVVSRAGSGGGQSVPYALQICAGFAILWFSVALFSAQIA